MARTDMVSLPAMKNNNAQNLLDNAYLFTYKAMVKCCTTTVVAHVYALLYRSEKSLICDFYVEKRSLVITR